MKQMSLRKKGHEDGKSIFNSESENVCNIENSQKVNQNFEYNNILYVPTCIHDVLHLKCIYTKTSTEK